MTAGVGSIAEGDGAPHQSVRAGTHIAAGPTSSGTNTRTHLTSFFVTLCDLLSARRADAGDNPKGDRHVRSLASRWQTRLESTRATASALARRCRTPPQIAPQGKALYSAVYHGHYDIAKLLLERGAFPNPAVELAALDDSPLSAAREPAFALWASARHRAVAHLS